MRERERSAYPDPHDKGRTVQVVVYTFNQADYIAAALDSVMAQQTDFPFTVLVHDDASTDGTREIIETYRDRHPGIIKCIFQKQNQFSQGCRIIEIVWPHLDAEIIALLDGDDVWTSPRKLQAQHDFFVQNSGCTICHTRVRYFSERKQRFIKRHPPFYGRRHRLGVEVLALQNLIHTCAVAFRKTALAEIPEDFAKLPYGDYALFSLIASAGWIGYIDEDMALYRIHETNMWISASERERQRKTRLVKEFIVRHLSNDQRKAWIRMRDRTALGLAAKAIRSVKFIFLG